MSLIKKFKQADETTIQAACIITATMCTGIIVGIAIERQSSLNRQERQIERLTSLLEKPDEPDQEF